MRNPYDIYLLWVFVVVYMKVKRLDFCKKNASSQKWWMSGHPSKYDIS